MPWLKPPRIFNKQCVTDESLQIRIFQNPFFNRMNVILYAPVRRDESVKAAQKCGTLGGKVDTCMAEFPLSGDGHEKLKDLL